MSNLRKGGLKMPEKQITELEQMQECLLQFAEGVIPASQLYYRASFEKAYICRLLEQVKRGSLPATEAAQAIEKLIDLIKLKS